MQDKRFLLFCLLMVEEAVDQLADLEESRPQTIFFSISKRVLNRGTVAHRLTRRGTASDHVQVVPIVKVLVK